MNVKLLCRLLGILASLIGSVMLLSLIWAVPSIGYHTDAVVEHTAWEAAGIRGLVLSSLISLAVGGLLFRFGRGADGKLFRKEAMAVVGLSWILATFLGALPYALSGTSRGPSMRFFDRGEQVEPLLLLSRHRTNVWSAWKESSGHSANEYAVLKAISNSSARGLSRKELVSRTGMSNAPGVFQQLKSKPGLGSYLIAPGEARNAPVDRAAHYRQRWMKMGLIDSMFESQSGFSTTGATVLNDLEDPYLVPHCILFWRSSTHFLGGLGIIALFVVILGQGSAGKSLMRAEMPGPTQESHNSKMQHTAWLFAATYTVLNIVLAIILFFLGMSVFDAICHAFATMATGGFSTYNASLGHFVADGVNGRTIEYVVMFFMLLAGTNFTLLLISVMGNPLQLLKDVEFKTYIGIITGVAIAIITMGLINDDQGFSSPEKAIRNGLFQVITIITTTGFGTADFDQWNHFSRGVLLVLMFVGGCAGSTGGGMKVIRYVLFVKILRIEIEEAYHPKIVRQLRIGDKPLEDQSLRRTIMVYFGLIAALFALGFLFVVLVEPDLTWGANADNKLIDSASAVASTLNNIGPGLGLVGPTQNYSSFCAINKVLFIGLMMLGRLEIFPIIVLFAPRFWRDQ
ncbi:TrkH family potassium uptake protein [Mariniblastus fucicola]|uniref:Trk system potassium uptake protein TrkG n=1 Tax=Mariniblastus fucicola TaxID=980251 RepID=A0A5B9PP10_9BACT|nr:TrkH family potassium uptake protein [Mariniblastus fucicola]QEG24291.1 Trk system potassium uptake protein TrkG [Mariniblastus fucicola]